MVPQIVLLEVGLLEAQIESLLERYPPPLGGGCLTRPEHMMRMVMGTEAFALVRTLRTFLGREGVGTAGAVELSLTWAIVGGVLGSPSAAW